MAAVDRPNLFVKIPATREGLSAIATVISEGISVNVTLIFPLAHYGEVIDAFLTGLERAAHAGRDLSTAAGTPRCSARGATPEHAARAAGLDTTAPGVLVTDTMTTAYTKQLIAAAGLHRVWERAPLVTTGAAPTA